MKLFLRSIGILESLLLGLIMANTVRAEIVPDNTLPVNSKVEAGCTTCTIDGGTAQGNNLFHSFREFSVPTSGAAVFNNDAQIQNIFTRVTGSSLSNIDGLLRTNGTANLFLLNPNGVIFGPNARLDVRGSFLTSTADAIAFPNGETFSASNPTQPSALLTINPNALLFNRLNPQPIINRSTANTTGLNVASGQSLAFVGGEVRLEGGQIQAPGGRVELGGVRTPGTVGVNVDRSTLSLSFPSNVAGADVLMSNNARVSVLAANGGDVLINARDFTMLGINTLLIAGIDSGLGFLGAQAGNIEINASGTIHLDAGTIANQTRTGAIGDSGDINIRADSIVGTNAATISTRVSGQGNGGNITITTGTLSLTNGAGLIGSTRGRGDAGDITVNARDTVLISGVTQDRVPVNSGIISVVNSGGEGEGGNITITTGSLYVTDGANLSSDIFGQGNAGNIILRARDQIVFDGVSSNGFQSQASSSVALEQTVGDGGDIQIQARSLTVTNGAGISTGTIGQGRSGNVTIDADEIQFSGGVVGVTVKDELVVYNTGILTVTERAATGRGGDIRIATNRLRVSEGSVLSAGTSSNQSSGNIQVDASTVELNNGGEITTSTYGSGSAGNIRVNATDRITLTGFDPAFDQKVAQYGIENFAPATASSGLFAQTEGTGQAGDIFIQSPQLIIRDQAQILASTAEASRGGNIQLNIPARLELSNNGQISASARSGTAGSLDVVAGSVELNSNSLISVEAGQGGIAGDLNITARQLGVDNSSVTVSNPQGQAGSLTIQASDIRLRDRAKLTAEAGGDSSTGTQQAEIQLQNVDRLLLRNGSLISARAEDNANGGNININAANGFLIAVPNENSDIIASANRGNGGRINIAAQQIFGLQASDRSSPFSEINASSEFGVSGVISITTPDVDLSRGLAELPADIIDASRLVAVGCSSEVVSQTNRGEFYQTGRGGIAPLPIDTVGSSDILEDMQPPQSWNTANAPIVEAQGWQRNDRGEVTLVATPTHSWHCGR
jgi:filamentous hemagglutinin family protein